jgi:hypothetical protein
MKKDARLYLLHIRECIPKVQALLPQRNPTKGVYNFGPGSEPASVPRTLFIMIEQIISVTGWCSLGGIKGNLWPFQPILRLWRQ